MLGLSLSDEEGLVEDAEWLLAWGRSVVWLEGGTADAAAREARAACEGDPPWAEGPKGDHKWAAAAAAGHGKA